MRRVACGLLLALLLGGLSAASASDTYTPPRGPGEPPSGGGSSYLWEARLAGNGATAHFLFEGVRADQATLLIVRCAGLQPGGTYTFSMLQDGFERGLGPAPHGARADDDGRLVYRASLGGLDLPGRFRVVVKQHSPTGGDAVVLKGAVYQQ